MERNIERILREARYVLENKCTVREGAKKFGVSKSTFHADVTYKLKDVDKETYEKVQRLMDYHFSIRHLRGGEATKESISNQNRPFNGKKQPHSLKCGFVVWFTLVQRVRRL